MDNELKMEPIQAVERAFQLLEAVAENGSMSLAELHKVVKVNKASLLRLAYTLCQNGYLHKDALTGDYSLTMKMYETGVNAIQNIDKMSIINSILANLSDETGRIAQFSIEDGSDLLCIQSIGQRTSTFSVYTNVGKRSPLYCTSAGKAILACYSNLEIMERFKTFNVQMLTRNTLTNVQDLLTDIAQVRQRQYALDVEENEYNVFCVGAAVLGSDGRPVGAISISGRTLTEEEEREIVSKLLPAAKLLSSLMGYVRQI